MSKIEELTNEASAMRTLRYVCTPDLVNDAKQIIGEALLDAQKMPTVSAQFLQLSWSHYARLMRVANEEECNLKVNIMNEKYLQ